MTARRRPIVAGNWKMHKTPDEAVQFVDRFSAVPLRNLSVDVILCAPFPALFLLKTRLRDGTVQLGAQNLHWDDAGPFTGEVSAPMLKSCGVQWVIVGHSERRHGMGEADNQIARKVEAAFRNGLRPIICVGETLEERRNRKMKQVVGRQLRAVATAVGEAGPDSYAVAYEPVWAIGTGVHATPAEVEEAHTFVRGECGKSGTAVRVLYGGSVTPENAGELMGTKGVDGFLVGGASLDPKRFERIVAIVEQDIRKG